MRAIAKSTSQHNMKPVPVMTLVYYPPLFLPTSSVQMKPFNRTERLNIPMSVYTCSYFSLVCFIMSMQKTFVPFSD